MKGRIMNIFLRKPLMIDINWSVNDTTVKTENIIKGKSGNPPTELDIPIGYYQDGWDTAYLSLLKPCTINAILKKYVYTVVWKVNDIIISTEQVEYGASAHLPEYTSKTIKIDSWDKDYTCITSDTEINAVVSSVTHQVKWVINGAVVKTEDVVYGNSAVPPEDTTLEGYTFLYWNRKYDNITLDTVITAVYLKSR